MNHSHWVLAIHFVVENNRGEHELVQLSRLVWLIMLFQVDHGVEVIG